jgi:hypothetical protein
VTLCYASPSPSQPLAGAPQRWRHLFQQWGFMCSCEMCQQEALAIMSPGTSAAEVPLPTLFYSLAGAVEAASAHEAAGALGEASAAWAAIFGSLVRAPELLGHTHSTACEAALHLAQIHLLLQAPAEAAQWLKCARGVDRISGKDFSRWARHYSIV